MKIRIRTLLVCVFLAVATFVAFEGVRHNEFINYDDDLYVTDNPRVQEGLNFESVAWAFTSGHASNWHPLTWISHIIDYAVFGANPAGHHLVSVGFHIANVILLFLILRKMTGAFWKSFFVAAVFGLHPLAVESVAWMAERKNVLSTFFAFLTIAVYFRYTKKPGFWRYLVVAILFAAGLLSKPMLVTLPFVLILLDYWPLKRFNSKFSILNSLYEKLPLLIMSAASCVVTYMAQAEGGTVADITAVPMNLRVGNALVSYIRYTAKIFYPASLGVLYPREVHGPALWQAGACLLLLVLVSALAFILRRRYGWLFTGWFWYLGTLVPVIGLIQVGVQGMADRYMYLPGIGIYVIVAWLIGNEAVKLRIPKVVIGAAGVLILGVLLMMTRVQVRYWKDGISLYSRTLAVTENNYMMQEKLGNLLRIAGRPDEAILHFRRAVEIRPLFAKAHTGLGLALADKGMFAEAAAQFERSLEIEPDSATTHNCYGVMLAEHGVYDKAMEQFGKALRDDTHFSGVLGNFCNAGIQAGKLDDVLNVIEDWKLKKPDDGELYYWAGIIYGQKDDKAGAVEQFDKAMKLAESQHKKELVTQIKSQLGKYRVR
ncbi:MAG: tetratricopeptide repeat protein [Planctomycetota bacterium]